MQDASFHRKAQVALGFFSVGCEQLNRELIRRATALVQRLIARMQQDAQVCVCGGGGRYMSEFVK